MAERQPALASKSVLDHRAPENEDVDATILPGRRSVLGLGEGCPRRRRSPRLDPGHVARLQLSDDVVGYFVIEIRPALAGARPNDMSRHRGSCIAITGILTRMLDRLGVWNTVMKARYP